MIRVFGIDHSLSTTGLARFDEGDEVPKLARVKLGIPTPATFEEELERIRAVAAEVVSVLLHRIQEDDDVLFVFEGNAPNATHSGKADERAALKYLIALNIRRHGRIIAVPPNTLKSYWSHNGSASKPLMLGWAERRYPELHIVDHNIADALALASMGARHRGIITPRPPLADETTLTRVRWPD